MRTESRNGVSLRSGIVLDDLGCELSVEILPTVAWCLRGWEFEKLHNVCNLWIRSPLGMSQEESLAGTHIGLHMSTAFVLVDIIIIKHWTSGGKRGGGNLVLKE